MTPIEREAIQQVLDAGGKVGPKTFVGRGMIISWCVRKGWLEWERGNEPKNSRATALFITDAGREILQANAGSVR